MWTTKTYNFPLSHWITQRFKLGWSGTGYNTSLEVWTTECKTSFSLIESHRGWNLDGQEKATTRVWKRWRQHIMSFSVIEQDKAWNLDGQEGVTTRFGSVDHRHYNFPLSQWITHRFKPGWSGKINNTSLEVWTTESITFLSVIESHGGWNLGGQERATTQVWKWGQQKI